MKEFKKYFFETLIQLTILATLFRQNGRLLNESNELLLLNDAENLSDGFLFARHRAGITDANVLRPYLNVNDLRLGDSFQLLNDNLTFLTNNITDQAQGRLRHKSSSLLEREVKILIQIVKKSTNTGTLTNNPAPAPAPAPAPGNNMYRLYPGINYNRYFVLPASFYSSCNNQKDIINLSETRLLLNSIELNNNQIIKDIEMDIDIQTLIQQDIDLGIKQSINYDFELANVNDPTFGTTSTGEVEFLKLLNENSSSSAKLDLEPTADFYLRQQLETQKNDDILTTTNLLDNESIPDGYKLVLEEDTGECFLILMRNDSISNPSDIVSSEHGDSDSGWGNFSQVIAAAKANETQPSEISQEVKSEPTSESCAPENHDEFNIQVKFSVFLKDEAISLLRKEYFKSESQIEPKESEPEPVSVRIDSTNGQNIPFLSQISVNNELDKLNTTKQQVNSIPTTSHSTNNNILTSLSESLNGYDNLLDDVWVNNLLSDEVQDQSQSQNKNQLQSQNQPEQTQISNVDFLIDDKMLSTLNSNSTILNDTNLIDQLANNNNNVNLNNNTSLLMDNFENYLTTDEQTFDLLFSDNVLVENQLNETVKSTLSTSNSQDDNLAFTFDQFEQILIKNGEFETTSTLISNSNQITFANHRDAVDNKNNNDKAILKTMQYQPQFSMDLKQEAIDVEEKILVSDLVHEQDQLPVALNGLRHNHTYLSTSNSQSDQDQTVDLHPYSYKSKMRKMLKNAHANDDSEQLRKNQSKDMALLKEYKVDLTLEQIVETSADEFGELMKANNLSPEQINLIKDIRRRAKNKVAAQICRKRKLDSIDSLKEQVDQLKQMKSNLLSEFNSIQGEIKDMTIKFDDLYKNAIGSSYDTNDPIVAFIKNLKDYNSKSTNANGARKTYDSNNSSDLDSDSSNSASPKFGKSSILNDFDNQNDYDDDCSEDTDDEDELFDDEDDDSDDLDASDQDDNQLFVKSKSSSKKTPPQINKYKKFKRN